MEGEMNITLAKERKERYLPMHQVLWHLGSWAAIIQGMKTRNKGKVRKKTHMFDMGLTRILVVRA